MKKFLCTAALTALLLPLSLHAGSLTLNGDTTNSPLFNRPTVTGALSFQTVRYDAYMFAVSLDGPYTLSLTAAEPAFLDTYLHIYQGAFNPADPEGNFFAANDDAPGGADAGSLLTGLNLTAGTTYYLVADGFSAADYGIYTATINGPGNVTASFVPEPSSFFLAVVAAAGVAGIARLRRFHGPSRLAAGRAAL